MVTIGKRDISPPVGPLHGGYTLLELVLCLTLLLLFSTVIPRVFAGLGREDRTKEAALLVASSAQKVRQAALTRQQMTGLFFSEDPPYQFCLVAFPAAEVLSDSPHLGKGDLLEPWRTLPRGTKLLTTQEWGPNAAAQEDGAVQRLHLRGKPVRGLLYSRRGEVSRYEPELKSWVPFLSPEEMARGCSLQIGSTTKDQSPPQVVYISALVGAVTVKGVDP